MISRNRLFTVVAAIASTCPALLAQGAQTLFEQPFTVFDADYQAQKLIDLDHDGQPELLTWWHANQPIDGQVVVTGFDVDSEGQLDLMWSFLTPHSGSGVCTSSGNATSTALGDFDGDGYEDFAISLLREAYVYSTRPDAVPVLHATLVSPLGLWMKELVAGDFDQNGLNDIAAADSQDLVAFLNMGDRFLASLPVGHTTFSNSRSPSLVVLDQDADQRDEIVVRTCRSFDDNLKVFGVDGGGVLQFEGFLPHDMPVYSNLTMGDIDEDGDQDLVLFRTNCATCDEVYQVLRQTSPGGFNLEGVLPGGPASHLIDIDGDGDLDGVCCGGGTGCDGTNDETSYYRIALNDGSGSFDDAIVIEGLSTGADGLAGALDYDGDGDLDLIGGRTILINHLQVGTTVCDAAANSTGLGAGLRASGSSSLIRSDLTLRGTGLPSQKSTVLVLGASPGSLPLGSGVLCMSAPLHRLATGTSSTVGNIDFPVDTDLFPNGLPGGMLVGATRYFQLWYRDDNADGFAFSDGIRVTFAP